MSACSAEGVRSIHGDQLTGESVPGVETEGRRIPCGSSGGCRRYETWVRMGYK